jgi:hypothetical protein
VTQARQQLLWLNPFRVEIDKTKGAIKFDRPFDI